ncbi:MAG: hypothetical protein V7K38_23155 [Nostoc sp.]|uniref:hypothetical protein n=1 Tax=Nostoc sp. TaxID=1180 RepID=UPI002FFC4755
MKQSQYLGIACLRHAPRTLHFLAIAITGFGSFISWNTLNTVRLRSPRLRRPPFEGGKRCL